MGLALLLVPGAGTEGAGAAVARALAASGWQVKPGPADPGEIVRAQLAAGPPFPEAVTWAADEAGLVLRVYPGVSGGLDPGLPRALSAELCGLVLAMEAARSREYYLLGSFLAGRTIELTVCEGGVVTGPGGRQLCDEDGVVARFTSWIGGASLLGLGLKGASALMAHGQAGGTRNPGELPFARIAVAGRSVPEVPGWRRREREGVVVLDRDGELDVSLATALGPAVGLQLPGGGGPATWLTLGVDGEVRTGTARGNDALVAAVPAWALVAMS